MVREVSPTKLIGSKTNTSGIVSLNEEVVLRPMMADRNASYEPSPPRQEFSALTSGQATGIMPNNMLNVSLEASPIAP